MKNKLYVLCVAILSIVLNGPVAYCQDAKSLQGDVAGLEQQYQKALGLYKQNKADAALVILEKLRRLDSNDVRYLYDYIAIACWSGRHDLATAAKGLNQNIAPAYVLEALAASQRQSKAYEASLNTYDLIVKRFPARVEAQVARVNTLIDAQHFKEAETQLSALRERYPSRMDVMECALRLSDSTKQPINTLLEAEKILKINPSNNFALRMRFYALKKLGAAHLAEQLTPKSVLSESEQIAAERDRLAFELRWARISADRPEQGSRWKELDAVITRLGEVCQLAESEGGASEVARGACGDLVAALSERGRTPEAIALYEKMICNGWDIQPYVQMSAATAYLDERQPEKAQELFRSALLKDPGNFDGRIGLIYALLESEQYKDADIQADQLTADTNEWVNPNFQEIREPNPNYPQAQLARAQTRSNTNRLSEAEKDLQLLALRAPNNTEIRQTLASTYNLRGWPRRAESDLEWLNAAQPTNAWTKFGIYENRMAVGDFRSAEQQLNAAAQLAPDEKFILRAQHDWETHNLPELIVESEVGKSDDPNSPIGSREVLLDAHLYSRPLNYNWRAFAHAQHAQSIFPELTVDRNSVGGGVEYRARDFSVTGEVRDMSITGTGYTLGGDYHIGDNWLINGLAEHNSLSAPVRAYGDGVSASNYQVGSEYLWHESRNVSLNINQMNFTDGNQRDAIDMSWTEGLLASATYKLDSIVEYSSSRNSSQSTLINYFNPISDQQVSITFRNEWSQFHRYEKSLKHVLAIGVGSYAQENFSTGSVMSIQYEGSYSPSDRLELHYGIGRNIHPYDGSRETRDAITFGADWKF